MILRHQGRPLDFFRSPSRGALCGPSACGWSGMRQLRPVWPAVSVFLTSWDVGSAFTCNKTSNNITGVHVKMIEAILVNNQAGFFEKNRLDLWNKWWYFDQYLNLLRDIFGWHMPCTSKMSLERCIASTPNNPVTVKSDTFSKRKTHGFFATIFRVRACWMQGFLPQMRNGNHHVSVYTLEVKHSHWNKIMAGRRKNSFPSKTRYPFQGPTVKLRGRYLEDHLI